MKSFGACFGVQGLLQHPGRESGGLTAETMTTSTEIELSGYAPSQGLRGGQGTHKHSADAVMVAVEPHRAAPPDRVAPPERTGLLPPTAPSTALGASRPIVADPAIPAGPYGPLNAAQLHSIVDPRHLHECDARDIMAGLHLVPRELGRGTYGVVVPGKYQGLPCAVKVMVSPTINRAVVREALLGPSLVHPNLVATYTSRCARLTHALFDMLEGPRHAPADTGLPRMLRPIVHSGDGFGDPEGNREEVDPFPVMHQILYGLKAVTGHYLTLTVQEYCDATTLTNAIARGVFRINPQWGCRLARRALLRTAAELARALLHLHDAGVVHGDLKPANVLLRSCRDDRRGFTVKVADFGLSHILPPSACSMAADTFGSIAYTAPEGFSNQVSRATDVWAFGVMLWQMLTSERPWEGMDHSSVVTGLQSGLLQLTWPVTEPMAQPIVALGRACLAFDPTHRPTARDILTEVVRIEAAIRAELVLGMQQQAAAAAAAAAAAVQAGGGSLSGSGGSGSATTSQEVQLLQLTAGQQGQGVQGQGVQQGQQGQEQQAEVSLQQRVVHATRQQIQRQMQQHAEQQQLISRQMQQLVALQAQQQAALQQCEALILAGGSGAGGGGGGAVQQQQQLPLQLQDRPNTCAQAQLAQQQQRELPQFQHQQQQYQPHQQQYQQYQQYQQQQQYYQ